MESEYDEDEQMERAYGRFSAPETPEGRGVTEEQLARCHAIQERLSMDWWRRPIGQEQTREAARDADAFEALLSEVQALREREAALREALERISERHPAGGCHPHPNVRAACLDIAPTEPTRWCVGCIARAALGIHHDWHTLGDEIEARTPDPGSES